MYVLKINMFFRFFFYEDINRDKFNNLLKTDKIRIISIIKLFNANNCNNNYLTVKLNLYCVSI